MNNKALSLSVIGMFLLSGPSMAATADKKLYIYNWSDYVAEDTISNFEKETGIDVVYDTFDSYDSVVAKLLVGKSGYDLVMLDAALSPPLIKSGIFQKIQKTELSGWSNLDTDILNKIKPYDKGLDYTMPYTWGSIGLTYNVDMIKERMSNAPVNSLDMLFKPEIVSKFADCGVTVIDVATDMIPTALSYLGLDPNSTKKSDLKKVEDLFSKIRPYIKKFDTSEYLNALPNKENCLSVTYSGDYLVASNRAKEVGADVTLKYNIPKEGAPIWFDALYIPSDARNVSAAHKFMEFLLQPQNIADVTNYIGYANANKESTSLVNPEISGDTGLYPDKFTFERLINKVPQDNKSLRILTRTWNAIKTGK